jgi:hypothetical protein
VYYRRKGGLSRRGQLKSRDRNRWRLITSALYVVHLPETYLWDLIEVLLGAMNACYSGHGAVLFECLNQLPKRMIQ